MAKVFIGVGHGGKDSGAKANGLIEKNLNLVTALACAEVLTKHGVNVLMSRTTDTYESASERAKESNGFKPDLSLDIHYNAGGGNGAECFYDYHGGTSKTLAEHVLTEIVAIGQNSRGAKTKKNILGQNYYAFIRLTNEPAIIVECVFLDNKEDITIIDTTQEQKAMGEAIAKGVLKTLGIDYSEPAQNPVATPSEPSEPVNPYYPKYNGSSLKIDTVLKTIGVPSQYVGSWKKRKPVAEANDIQGYTGKASENLKLITLAKAGYLIKV